MLIKGGAFGAARYSRPHAKACGNDVKDSGHAKVWGHDVKISG